MVRQSPRNQRSKGFKIKHALQIGLLLAVCIWLLYQVKHSHDKKKIFDESNAKISENVQNDIEILRLGRKDLRPRVEETANEDERHNREEETEGEGSKPEESVDEGREGRDIETDEHDRENAEHEDARRKDFVDEKERDEESESKGGEEEGQNKDTESLDHTLEEGHQIKDTTDLPDDQDHDTGDRNTQEAREEHYKRDDASSAVIRNAEVTMTETENGGNSNEEEQVKDTEKNEPEQEGRTNRTDEVNIGQDNSNPKVGEGVTTEISMSVNATANEENGNESSSPNSVVMKLETNVSSMENGTSINLHSAQERNATTETRNSNGDDSNLQAEKYNATVESEQSDLNATLSTATENADASKSDESTKSFSNSESVVDVGQTAKSDATTAVTEDRSASLTTNESVDTEEKSNTSTETKEANESEASSTTNEIVQRDPIDSSIPQEEKDVHTDLETLPEIKTEEDNENALAE